MHAPRIQAAKALAFLAAAAAGLGFGAPALGMVWDVTIVVGQVRFALPAGFPFAFLAGALALAAWGHAGADGRRWFGSVGLAVAGATVLGAYTAILTWWAPWGGTQAQLGLLLDVARLGFTMLALSLPVILPEGTPTWVRGMSGAAGLALTPLLLFPASADAAGIPGALDALPMALFFTQALLAYGDSANARAQAWQERRNDAWENWEEPRIETLRATRARRERTEAMLLPRRSGDWVRQAARGELADAPPRAVTARRATARRASGAASGSGRLARAWQRWF